MTNLTKIFRLLLVAVFCCVFGAKNSFAQVSTLEYPTGNFTAARDNTSININPIEGAIRQPIATTNEDGSRRSKEEIAADIKAQEDAVLDAKKKFGAQPASQDTTTVEIPKSSISINKKAAISDVSGCSADYGLFSGLITAGGKIFTGLRELIYVVAGFGIIGVSVGGFFGNLNYKWLGAIVISLVVIATTGELINAITGCETFTTSVITDTLK